MLDHKIYAMSYARIIGVFERCLVQIHQCTRLKSLSLGKFNKNLIFFVDSTERAACTLNNV